MHTCVYLYKYTCLIFAPEATAVARTVHIESYSDIQDMVAQQLGVGADAVQVKERVLFIGAPSIIPGKAMASSSLPPSFPGPSLQ